MTTAAPRRRTRPWLMAILFPISSPASQGLRLRRVR